MSRLELKLPFSLMGDPVSALLLGAIAQLSSVALSRRLPPVASCPRIFSTRKPKAYLAPTFSTPRSLHMRIMGGAGAQAEHMAWPSL